MRDAPPAPLTRQRGLRSLYADAVREGWSALLEIVLVSLLWFLFVFIGGTSAYELVTAFTTHHQVVVLYAFAPLLLPGPATVGLFASVDAIWARSGVGPFEAIGNFFRGFGRHYLRSVGLGALWILLLLGAYANIHEGPHVFPFVISVATRIMLIYLLIFAVMVNTYLISILATADFDIWNAIRLAAWQAMANPLYTLGTLLVPAAVLLLGIGLKPILPLLVGGATAFFSTAADRYAPLRNPELPPVVWLDEPMPDEETGGEETEDAEPPPRERR